MPKNTKWTIFSKDPAEIKFCQLFWCQNTLQKLVPTLVFPRHFLQLNPIFVGTVTNHGPPRPGSLMNFYTHKAVEKPVTLGKSETRYPHLPPGPNLPMSSNFHPTTAWFGGNQSSKLIMARGGGGSHRVRGRPEGFPVPLSIDLSGFWFRLSQLKHKFGLDTCTGLE